MMLSLSTHPLSDFLIHTMCHWAADIVDRGWPVASGKSNLDPGTAWQALLGWPGREGDGNGRDLPFLQMSPRCVSKGEISLAV